MHVYTVSSEMTIRTVKYRFCPGMALRSAHAVANCIAVTGGVLRKAAVCVWQAKDSARTRAVS
jgi:hypothetical protein